MYTDRKIWLAQSEKGLYLLPSMANRHGLIAGATGTGKTITMKVLAESFSDMGVPVFLADVKGDLTGMCQPGQDSADMRERIEHFSIENFEYKKYPTRFWDIFGEEGIPVRVTVSSMGPTLLARLLGLTEIQAGVLNIAFHVADDNGLLLLDLKDLRAMLQFVGDNRAEFTTAYGNVSAASIGAIQRSLLAFENEGAEQFFGEPELNIKDWMRTDLDGRGYINILSSRRLIQSPTVYGTFLLWMLSELFEQLPEVHLLFTDAPKALVQKIVQVVKLIRSKGVGVYFISQSPSDIPNDVLAQLSNRVQHALRAYTPAEQKAVRAAARAFRVNKDFDTEQAIMELGVGEALVSLLDEDGIPTVVERARILPPQSLMGPADDKSVKTLVVSDEFDLKYRESVDRESAFEILTRANEELERQRAAAAEETEAEKQRLKAEKEAERQRLKEEAAAEKQRLKEEAAAEKQRQKEAEEKKKIAQRAVTNAASSVAGSISTNIINSLTGKKTKSTKTIAQQAARNALSSVMRSGSSSIVRAKAGGGCTLRRFVGLADFFPLGVVLHIFHQAGVNAAALLDDHSLPLDIEHPDLAVGKVRIRFAENAALIQAAELGPPLRGVQQVTGAVVKQLVFHRILLELLPVLVIDLHYIIGFQHIILPSAAIGSNIMLTKVSLSLLFAPSLHHKAGGQMLHQLHLYPLRKAQNRGALPLFHVLQRFFDYLLRRIIAVEVVDGVIMDGMVKELRGDPAGADRHNPDSPILYLHSQRFGKIQHIGLGSAVDIDIGHRLPGGHGAHVVDSAALGHIGQAHIAHGGEGPGVQVNDIQLSVHIHLGKSAEKAETGGIDQHGNLRLLLLQQGLINPEAAPIQQIQRDGAHLGPALLPQLHQPGFPTGNHPKLIELLIPIQRVDKLPPHAGGRTGYHCNFHVELHSVFEISVIKIPQIRYIYK